MISNRCKVIVLMCFVLMQLALAQRPSFAGSRPADGLNQKDKYHMNTLTATPDIANRFGAGNSTPTQAVNQLAFGQTQRPPQGAIVFPESNYVPIQTTSNTGGNNVNNVNFADRFGSGSDDNTAASATSTSAAASTPRPYVPLDAHGDQQLIDKLNSIPIDHRPFWYINALAIEAQRNGTTTNFANAQGSGGHFAG